MAEALQYCLNGERAFNPQAPVKDSDIDDGHAETYEPRPVTLFTRPLSRQIQRSTALPTPPEDPRPTRSVPGVAAHGRYTFEPTFEEDLAPNNRFLGTARPLQSR